MPYIRKYNNIFESVRLPIKFWNAPVNLPVLTNISSDNYIGENKFPYYIKSCNFCLTPFLIKRYGNTSGTISNDNIIFKPDNSQNIDITYFFIIKNYSFYRSSFFKLYKFILLIIQLI